MSKVFDPFKDYDTAGYLRNRLGAKDLEIVKRLEHDAFVRNMPNAIAFLSQQNVITYNDFLEVHRLLFAELYPWAGQDRSATMPNSLVTKGTVVFSHPEDTRQIVAEGLLLGSYQAKMEAKPGRIMGLFAYGHPFLDCNGRAMLLVHTELAHRAGYSINWNETTKNEYLAALTDEIGTPNKGILDNYLLKFIGPKIQRAEWGQQIVSVRGLDGLDDGNQIEGDFSDPVIAKKYRDFEAQRDYDYKEMSGCRAISPHSGQGN